MESTEDLSVPSTLEECFIALDKVEDIEENFIQLDEKIAVAQAHHTLGTWIRNNWGLWKMDSKIFELFKNLGVTFADDISGLILTSYHRVRNGKNMDIIGQVKEITDFYANQPYHKNFE